MKMEIIKKCLKNKINPETCENILYFLTISIFVCFLFLSKLLFLTLIVWSIGIKNQGFDDDKRIIQTFSYTFFFTIVPTVIVIIPEILLLKYIFNIQFHKNFKFFAMIFVYYYLLACLFNYIYGTSKGIELFEEHIYVAFMSVIITNSLCAILIGTSVYLFNNLYNSYIEAKNELEKQEIIAVQEVQEEPPRDGVELVMVNYDDVKSS